MHDLLLASLRYLGIAIAGLSFALALDAVLWVRYPDFEVTGRRAGNRLRAMKTSVLLTALWPVLRFFTAYAAMLPLPRIRARIERWLRQADDPAGFVPSEIIGISMLLGIALGLLAGLQFAWAAALPAMLLGLYLPYDKVRGAAEQREGVDPEEPHHEEQDEQTRQAEPSAPSARDRDTDPRPVEPARQAAAQAAVVLAAAVLEVLAPPVPLPAHADLQAKGWIAADYATRSQSGLPSAASLRRARPSRSSFTRWAVTDCPAAAKRLSG